MSWQLFVNAVADDRSANMKRERVLMLMVLVITYRLRGILLGDVRLQLEDGPRQLTAYLEVFVLGRGRLDDQLNISSSGAARWLRLLLLLHVVQMCKSVEL